ncbi:sugar transferase [Halalkalibacter sp. APA_J-10(15)]|uniref:sugar transferase n=1 Tax=Halalkalibacter sp. APA_J-10(15) TaxID=2933805 RepID=UPI00236721A1|nr:sugar transferase [Halalkalibacter sp. APA_J-10(15)]
MSNMFPKRTSRLFIILIDLSLLMLAYLAAFKLASYHTLIEPRNIEALVSIMPWILLMAVLFIYIFELDRLVKRDYTEIFRKLLVVSLGIMVLTIAASFLFREFSLPRSVIFLSHSFMFVMWFFWKSMYVRIACKVMSQNVLFIGDESELDLIRENLLDSKVIKRKDDVSWLNKDLLMKDIKMKMKPYELVFIGSTMTERKKNDILYYAMKQKQLSYMIPNTNELFIMKTSFTTLGDTMVLEVKPFTLSSGQMLAKRLLDVFVSAILLLLSAPIMVATAIAIKLEDRGPVFFKQERVGKHNKPFQILKFRSMIVDAEAKTGPVLAKSSDSRITKVGAFIRKTRIDELPQLLNVLKGSMSLVGPRPEREYFAKKFEKENKWFYYRGAVKPGITGFAQVFGYYTTSADSKLKFDLYYIRHYSIWLDIVLLFRTILVVLNKSQAEGQQDKQKTIEKKISMMKSGIR